MSTLKIWIYAKHDNFIAELKEKINKADNFIITRETDNADEISGIQNEIPDIIFLDLEVLDTDDYTKFIKNIIQKYKSAKLIILLPDENEEIIYSAICNGVYDYYIKSTPLTNVKEKMLEVVNSDTPFGAVLKNKIKRTFERVTTLETQYNFTEREKEILNLMIAGLTKRKMAEVLMLSFHTIDSHLRNIYRKLGVQSKSQAVAKVLKGTRENTE